MKIDFKLKNDMFETERLRIRNFEKNDTERCFASWGKDNGLGRYILLYPMRNVSQMNELVSSFVHNENAWLLEEKITGSVVGYVTVDVPYDFLKIGEIGYVIAEKFQRNGYAFEALSSLIRFYLHNKDFYLLEAKYNEENIASSKLLNKLGFQVEAILRGRRIDRLTDVRSNMVICSITKDEEEEMHRFYEKT